MNIQIDRLRVDDYRAAKEREVREITARRPADMHASPKLRPLGGFHSADLGFCGLAGMASVYVRVRGMGAPIRSKARRWVGVGAVSLATG